MAIYTVVADIHISWNPSITYCFRHETMSYEAAEAIAKLLKSEHPKIVPKYSPLTESVFYPSTTELSVVPLMY